MFFEKFAQPACPIANCSVLIHRVYFIANSPVPSVRQYSSENKAVIVSAVRTPFGKFGKSLKDFTSPALGALSIREALNRFPRIHKGEVAEVLMGNVVSAGEGQNPARQSSLLAGLPVEVGATTINKVCGSGLKAIMLAAQSIRAGDSECVVAGGMESMSQCPHLLKDLRWGLRMGDSKMLDAMILDGLWDAYNNYHMGMTGEIIAEKYGVTREEADIFSLDSYRKASKAISDGAFRDEIVPVNIKLSNGTTGRFEVDECVRGDTTIEGLRSLKPVFKPNGVLTPGNSSKLADGAAAVVVTSEAKARSLDQGILARIVEYDQIGVKPELVMEAPIPATRNLLKKANFSMQDIDLVEHNEAYSTASIAVQRELDIPDSKFNINGGAVALGHPLGCTGAALVAKMIFSLRKRKLHRGLVTLCLGGGEAVAMILEV